MSNYLCFVLFCFALTNMYTNMPTCAGFESLARQTRCLQTKSHANFKIRILSNGLKMQTTSTRSLDLWYQSESKPKIPKNQKTHQQSTLHMAGDIVNPLWIGILDTINGFIAIFVSDERVQESTSQLHGNIQLPPSFKGPFPGAKDVKEVIISGSVF